MTSADHVHDADTVYDGTCATCPDEQTPISLAIELARVRYMRFRESPQGAALDPVPYGELSARMRRLQIDQAIDDATWFFERLRAEVAAAERRGYKTGFDQGFEDGDVHGHERALGRADDQH